MSEEISKIISKYKMYMSFDGYEYETIQKVELNKTFEEIEKLHNIIKEVREYIENGKQFCDYDILEILDKEKV